METPSSPPSQTPVRNRGTAYILQVTVVAAAILATLFTAWTDPNILPGRLGNQVVAGIAPLATDAAQGAATPTPRLQPLIGIVAGHSGFDSGAVCPDGLTEASVNEKIASFVQQTLSGQGYDVDLLQEFDNRLTGYQATVLVSIHADSCDYINDIATGYKVSSALASPHKDRSARLVGCLRNRYAQATGLLFHNSITADMTSYHAFEEIHPDTTAAIIEVGFLNLDRSLLTQEPERAAQGIVDGILCFIRNEDIATSTP